MRNHRRLARAIQHWIRAVRTAVFWCLDSTLLLFPCQQSDTAVVVRLDNIGDFVLWLQSGVRDVITELRRRHRRIVIVGNASWTPLAHELGLFDEVIGILPSAFMRHPLYRWRMLLAIRRIAASTIVNPRGGRVYLMEDEIVRISGAFERVAVVGLPLNIDRRQMTRSDRYYTCLINAGEGIHEHESIRNERFADAFCVERLHCLVDPRPLVHRRPPGLPDKFFAVAPGAGAPGRRWPVERFASVIDELHRLTGRPCIVVGAASDRSAAESLRVLSCAPVEDHTGQHTLAQTVAVLAAADLLLTNDSGPLHIATWVGTRVIALMGGGQFGWFAPYPPGLANADRLTVVHHPMPCYGCNWHCRFDVGAADPYPCVERIAIAPVENAAIAAVARETDLRPGAPVEQSQTAQTRPRLQQPGVSPPDGFR